MVNPEDLYKKANSARKAGRFSEAETLYNQTIAQDPFYWDAWNSMGCLYLDDLHNYSKAEEIFKKCIALNPQHEWGYSNLACVYCETRQWQLAKSYAEKALSKRRYGDALVSLGRAQLGLGQTQESIQTLQEAARVPNYPFPHYYLALTYEKLKDSFQVIRSLRKALAIKPDFKEAQQMLTRYHSNPH